jgi:chemotaxis family two-component system sensor kinase Cph1
MTQDERRFAEQEQELHVQQAELEQQNEELRQINMEVELAHNRYADLFDFAPVAYVVLDETGLIEEINRTGCMQLSTDRTQLLGRPFSLFVDPHQRDLFNALLSQTLQTPRSEQAPHRADLRIVDQDGGRWDARIECTALDGPHGLLARMVLTDISELKRSQRDAEHRAAENELLTTELQSILRAMTHDLTRPLRQVVGFAGLLGNSLEAPDEASARHLKHLLLAASDMDALTASLTEFFQSSLPEGAPQRLDLNGLLDEIFRELEPRTQGRQIALTHAPLPTVQGDRQSLRTVFSHLLTNAVKFTPAQREARIHVDVVTTEESNVFSVQDNGVGFDSHQSERMFGAFVRLHSGQLFEGRGLGLALVRRVVERLHGQVWAESVIGQGSTFYVRLPREEANAEHRAPNDSGDTGEPTSHTFS